MTDEELVHYVDQNDQITACGDPVRIGLKRGIFRKDITCTPCRMVFDNMFPSAEPEPENELLKHDQSVFLLGMMVSNVRTNFEVSEIDTSEPSFVAKSSTGNYYKIVVKDIT